MMDLQSFLIEPGHLQDQVSVHLNPESGGKQMPKLPTRSGSPPVVSGRNKHLNWKGMIDHIGAVILVMAIWLRAACGISGARH
jgi:hypothetical protein